jgi:ATP-dependent helicase/nuclease subunit B
MTVPPASATTSGIRILDAMQARGLTFRHVALVGMNAGIFPHVGREDPFLPDAARAKLVTATGRFLPLASHRDREEHLILGMVLRAARDRLAISWRRADESGRPVVPSLALRDIARLTGRGTTAHDVEAAAMALPSHPRARLSCWATTPGLLRGDEEALLTALGSELGISTAPAVLERLPALAAGIALVMATDAFAPGAGFYDGRVGPGFATAHLAATALERLGACPLQFFFRHVLRVRVEPDAATPFELDAASVGRRVHDVLRDVYRTLAEEDAFETLAVPARAARARQLLRASWTACATADDIELAARFPILDGIAERRWLATLDSFFDADLARLEDRGLVPVAFESQVEKPVPGGPAELIVKARYDRISVGAGGSVIGDYKTGGSLGARIAPSAMLSGEKLQVPLYALLEEAAVELLGVGPRHVPEPGAAPDPRFERFDGFKNEAQRGGVIETLHVLARLPVDGRFPLRAGQHCRYCDYADACRRHHPPTEHRESSASDTRDVRDCWDKQNGAPRIADVRAASVA